MAASRFLGPGKVATSVWGSQLGALAATHLLEQVVELVAAHESLIPLDSGSETFELGLGTEGLPLQALEAAIEAANGTIQALQPSAHLNLLLRKAVSLHVVLVVEHKAQLKSSDSSQFLESYRFLL